MAELPDFPLAEWELPPDSDEKLVAPADLQFEASFFGVQTALLARAVADPQIPNRSRIFVRDFTQKRDGNWLCTHIDHPEKGCEEAARELETYREAIVFAAARGGERVIFIGEPGETWCEILLGTSGARFECWGNFKSAFDLGWDFLKALPDLSSEDAHAEILRAWDDPQSDFRYALNWAFLNGDEKCAHVVKWGRVGQNAADFRALCQKIALCVAPRLGKFWRFEFYLEDTHESYDLTLDILHANTPEFLEFWHGVLLDYFAPWFCWDNLDRLCILDYFQRHSDLEILVDLSAPDFQSPSAHQRLEAFYEINLWLGEREKSGEISAQIAKHLRATLR